MNINELLKPGTKVAFYGRCSTKDQDIVMQRTAVQALVNEFDCICTHEFLDEGVSSRTKALTEREALQNLLKEAVSNSFDVIIVFKEDRLARDVSEHKKLRGIFNGLDIPVIISSSRTLYNQDSDILTTALKDALTKYEILTLLSRTSKGRSTKATHGIWLGGKPPFGYKYDVEKKLFVTIPEQMWYVKNIFKLYLKGNGFQAISDMLPKGTRHGKDWRKEHVKNIILNPFYCGIIAWNKTTNGCRNDRDIWIAAPNNTIPAVITNEIWEACWKEYINRKDKKISPKKYKTSFLLQELLVCENCQIPLQGKNQETQNKKYGCKIYVCSSCKMRIKADDMHENIVNYLLEFIRKFSFDDLYESVIKRIELEITEKKKQIKSHEKQIELIDMKQVSINQQMREYIKDDRYTALIFSLDTLKNENLKKRQLLNDQVNEMKEYVRYKELVEKDKDYWKGMIHDIEVANADTLMKRRILLHILDKVIVKKYEDTFLVSFQMKINLQKHKFI